MKAWQAVKQKTAAVDEPWPQLVVKTGRDDDEGGTIVLRGLLGHDGMVGIDYGKIVGPEPYRFRVVFANGIALVTKPDDEVWRHERQIRDVVGRDLFYVLNHKDTTFFNFLMECYQGMRFVGRWMACAHGNSDFLSANIPFFFEK